MKDRRGEMIVIQIVRAALTLFGGRMPRCAWQRLMHDETGQDTMEYALIAAIISLCAVASIKSVGAWVSGAFTTISTSVSSTV